MVPNLIVDWAAAHPRIRRVWMSGGDLIALEVEPVADSEETFAVWIANCRKWHAELEARLGRRVSLACLDPDVGLREPLEELVYDSLNASGAAPASWMK
jgi:hypothetical protein